MQGAAENKRIVFKLPPLYVPTNNFRRESPKMPRTAQAVRGCLLCCKLSAVNGARSYVPQARKRASGKLRTVARAVSKCEALCCRLRITCRTMRVILSCAATAVLRPIKKGERREGEVRRSLKWCSRLPQSGAITQESSRLPQAGVRAFL